MTLETIDVTEHAENDNKLLEIFKEKTTRDDGSLQGWQSGRKPQVRGPYSHTFALIIKHSSEDGTVKILLGNAVVSTYQTSPMFSDKATMVLLTPQHYCWWLAGAEIKCII